MTFSQSDLRFLVKSLEEKGHSLIEKLERSIADYCEVQYAVAFSSDTAAKMAAYFAIQLQISDQVFHSANAPMDSLNAPIQKGNRVHLIDIDPDTGNMDLADLKNKLKVRSSRGRPIILAHHFAGIPLDMSSIDGLISHPEAVLVEDASNAFGSVTSNGKKIGCCEYSQLTLFSFSKDKLITTEQGGVATTNDPKLFQRLKLYRNNGIDQEENQLDDPWLHPCKEITGNFHPTSFQAAIGLSQLNRIDQLIVQRQELMQRYRENLEKMPFVRLLPAWQLCVTQIDFAHLKKSKLELFKALTHKGIDSNTFFPPLYKQPLVGSLLDWEVDYPKYEHYYSQTLALPLYNRLTIQQIDGICAELANVTT